MNRPLISRRLSVAPAAGLAAILASGQAPAALARARTLDNATVLGLGADAMQSINQFGDMRGMLLGHVFRTHDAESRPLQVNGQPVARTVDSTGAFLIGELERLDPQLHMPLSDVSWTRDIDVRTDVTIADEFSSFSETTFGSAGTLGAGNSIRNGKAWMGKNTDQIGGVSVDTQKTPNPLFPWGLEVRFTIFELESAAKLGRPIDEQKITALNKKHQMDVDEQAYVGDSSYGVTGLLNNARVTNVSNVVNGASASPLWTNKTPTEILKDINDALQSSWAASGYQVMPRNVLVPPSQFGYLSTTIVSSAGNQSILKYLLENNIVAASGQGGISIKPCKWLVGCGSGGAIGTAGTVDRFVVYTKKYEYVRFPMTGLQRTPVQFQSIYHMFTYYCRLGVVEVVYPETVAYRDGI